MCVFAGSFVIVNLARLCEKHESGRIFPDGKAAAVSSFPRPPDFISYLCIDRILSLHHWSFFSRNIPCVTPKIICFYYQKIHFQDQRKQNNNYLILKENVTALHILILHWLFLRLSDTYRWTSPFAEYFSVSMSWLADLGVVCVVWYFLRKWAIPPLASRHSVFSPHCLFFQNEINYFLDTFIQKRLS